MAKRRTLSDLARSMDKLSANLPKAVSKVAADSAFEGVVFLAFNTGVDTSNALSNWQVSLNNMISDDSEIQPHVRGHLGDTQKASAEVTITLAKQILSRKKPGQVLYISNVVDYIETINKRGTRTNPQGRWFEGSLRVIEDHLKKSKLKVRYANRTL